MVKDTEVEKGKHSIIPPAPKKSFLDSAPNRISRTIAQIRTGHWLCAPYLFYLLIYSISFNVIQPMWLCRQIQTHKIADMSERRKQANKQKKTKQHT
jgi:hypothetical protein